MAQLELSTAKLWMILRMPLPFSVSPNVQPKNKWALRLSDEVPPSLSDLQPVTALAACETG
jgi:hypothetical protein